MKGVHANLSQYSRILRLLQAAGSDGVTNVQLNRIAFRYGAVIHDMRKAGHDVLTIRDSNSRYRFVYKGGPNAK